MSSYTTKLNPNWIATASQLPKHGQRVYVSSKAPGTLLKLIFNAQESKWYFEEKEGVFLSYVPEMWKERGTSLWG